MHAGSIDNPDTAAHRVYTVLKALDGNWIGGWDLTIRSQASAMSTRVSEIRKQLEREPDRGEAVESEQRGTKWFYRIVKVTKGQQLLAV